MHEIEGKLTPANLSKAFDTLNFNFVLYKLQYYGITDIVLNLQTGYMSNRKQYGKYNVNKYGYGWLPSYEDTSLLQYNSFILHLYNTYHSNYIAGLT